MLVAGQHDVDQERMVGDMPDRESDVGEGVESLSSESSAMDQTLSPLDVLAGPVGVRWPDEMRRMVARDRGHTPLPAAGLD